MENKKRYFMFVYSYWTKVSKGKGNLCCSVIGNKKAQLLVGL